MIFHALRNGRGTGAARRARLPGLAAGLTAAAGSGTAPAGPELPVPVPPGVIAVRAFAPGPMDSSFRSPRPSCVWLVAS